MPAFVQKALGGDNAGTLVSSFSATASGGFTANNAIVGAMTWYGSTTTQANISAISDGTKSYNVAASTVDYLKNSDNVDVLTFLLTGITPGATTITVTFASQGIYCRLAFHEISGAGFVDVHGINTQSGAGSAVGPNITTNYNGEYVYLATVDTVQSTTFGNNSTGFTIENLAGSSDNVAMADEYQILTSAGLLSGGGFTSTQTPSDFISAILAISAPRFIIPQIAAFGPETISILA
jgi:hypothetical protein